MSIIKIYNERTLERTYSARRKTSSSPTAAKKNWHAGANEFSVPQTEQCVRVEIRAHTLTRVRLRFMRKATNRTPFKCA